MAVRQDSDRRTDDQSERALRVLMVVNTLPPTDLSGAGEQVVQLSSALADRGHRVELLGRGRGGARGPKMLFPVMVLPALLLALWRREFDVVQLHESDGGLAAVAVRLLGFGRRPFLVALQQVSYRQERRAVRPLRDLSSDDQTVLAKPAAAERRFRTLRTPVQILLGILSARLADLVLVPSETTGRELEADYGLERWQVLPNVTGAPIPGRDEVGIPQKGPADRPAETREGSRENWIFVGRLRIRKGVEVLLHALTELDSESRHRLLIVGDGERRASLEAKAAELGLTEQVRFLGKQPPAEIRRLLAASVALVVPSTYEGMPLVILEAMEQGTPVVASAVSGIPEVVVDGETGWLVPAENVAALAKALDDCTADPSEAERRGRKGRQRLDRHYRPQNAARLWLDAVLPLLAGR